MRFTVGFDVWAVLIATFNMCPGLDLSADRQARTAHLAELPHQSSVSIAYEVIGNC